MIPTGPRDLLWMVGQTLLGRVRFPAMGTRCSFKDCVLPSRAKGYCEAHYQQSHRGEELQPLRTPRGDGERITVRMDGGLHAEIKADAEKRKEDLGEWMREAARQRLKGRVG